MKKTAKEWLTIGSHLIEFNIEDKIPLSQKAIDWEVSDHENGVDTFKRKALKVLKSKRRKKSEINKIPQSEDENESVKQESLNNYIICENEDESLISPVLRTRPILRCKPCISNAMNILESGSTLSKQNFNSMKGLEDEEFQYLSQTISSPVSPIIKSRIMKRSVTAKDYKNLSKGSKYKDNACVNAFAEILQPDEGHIEKTEMKSKPTNILDKLLNVDAEINVADSHENICTYDDQNSLISTCSSPAVVVTKMVEPLSSAIDQQLSKEVLSTRKGSEWVKDIYSRSPHLVQSMAMTVQVISDAPDSSRKRIKKDGLAAPLQRFVQSWRSNFSMWNHQMSLAALNEDISCLLSPQSTCSAISYGKPHNFSCSQKTTSESSIESNINLEKTILKTGSNGSLETRPINNGTAEILARNRQSCIRNLRKSLEIGSSQSSELSSKTNFIIPKKHLCMRVKSVEWQTAVMRSAICQEIDLCSFQLKEERNLSHDPRLFFIIFEWLDNKACHKSFEVGCLLKIFAPWRVLHVKEMPFPTLISSYYVVKSNGEIQVENQSKNVQVKSTKLASWNCSCLLDSHIIPSTCFGGAFNVNNVCLNNSYAPSCDARPNSSFDTVRDFQLGSSPESERYWTVAEAIEQCGSSSGILVIVTLRIRKRYTIRKQSCSAPTHYWVLGQDPSGVFLLIEVPNRPLKKTLDTFLRGNEGRLSTLTHLSVAERISDTQNPGLFSVIHSLQSVYRESVATNKQLSLFLEDQLKRPPQSFCYKFVVSLGQTVDIRIAEKEGFCLTLPEWILEDTWTLNVNGSRGVVPVNILYYVDPYLYVTCARPQNSSKETINSNSLKRIHRIRVKNSASFPAWVKCSGTILVTAVIKDAVVLKGCLTVDEFSQIEKIDKELSVPFNEILPLIPEFDLCVTSFDLVVINGSVQQVNEDEACSWDECCVCRGRELHSISHTNVRCRICETENVSPITKYSLEVGLCLHCHKDNFLRIRVKLFQATIKHLLEELLTVNNQYRVDSILGKEVGPLVCVVKSVERKGIFKSFMLQELPY